MATRYSPHCQPYFFTLKPLLAKIIRLPQVDEGLYGDYARSLVGQEAMVFKEITREPGQLNFMTMMKHGLLNLQMAVRLVLVLV